LPAKIIIWIPAHFLRQVLPTAASSRSLSLRRHEAGVAISRKLEGLPARGLLRINLAMTRAPVLLDFLEETVGGAGVADRPRRFGFYQNRIVIAVFPDFFHLDIIS